MPFIRPLSVGLERRFGGLLDSSTSIRDTLRLLEEVRVARFVPGGEGVDRGYHDIDRGFIVDQGPELGRRGRIGRQLGEGLGRLVLAILVRMVELAEPESAQFGLGKRAERAYLAESGLDGVLVGRDRFRDQPKILAGRVREKLLHGFRTIRSVRGELQDDR